MHEENDQINQALPSKDFLLEMYCDFLHTSFGKTLFYFSIPFSIVGATNGWIWFWNLIF